MTTTEEHQKFLDENQYSVKSILRYEAIFGHTWVSTGGKTTTAALVEDLNLKPESWVLDVGCGSGGSAFYMARHFGANVIGVDLSSHMLGLAQKRIRGVFADLKDKVTFMLADVTKLDMPEASFDVIYSRDTMLHIHDKLALYTGLRKLLKPGGKLLITDYCSGDKKHSQEFTDYVASRGYDLPTVHNYGETIRKSGFNNVEAIDYTDEFVRILKMELENYKAKKEEVIKEFSQEDYDYIVNGWEAKLVRCAAGDQKWGLFRGTA